MTKAVWELAQFALALWLIPAMPVLVAYLVFDWWGLTALGWPLVWFIWLLGGRTQ